MLELKNIYKTFPNAPKPILNNINLSIKKGDFVAIIGQSGSGKSTLMNIIGTLDTPNEGSYTLEDVDVLKLNQNALASLRQKKFGFIFQSYNLLSSLSALENVALPAVYAGVSQKQRNKKAKELLDELGLENKYKSLPRELSGGQQQRVSIARSLINGGEIILADEPTGALDSKSGEVVMKNIQDLHVKGHTIILVTHDLNIAKHANRVIEIKDGEILSDVSKEALHVKNDEKKQTKKSFWFFKDQLIESFKMALSSIKSHKLRSILTMLGIIIGIASVVSVVALGNGSKQKILSDISSIGTNSIKIFPGLGFGDMRSGRYNSLKMSDVKLLKTQEYLHSVTPDTESSGTLTYKNISLSGGLVGGSEDTFAVNGIKLQDGRLLSAEDIKTSASVIVIDENTKNNLFKNVNPLGEVIMFNKKPFKVVGIAKEADPRDTQSLRIWTPYSTVMNKITGDRNVRTITLRVKDDFDPKIAEKRLTNALIAKHGSRDFFTRNSDTIRETIENTTSTMTLLISAIAVISLIVGGIGVMNIMLVSVTERTKEIGIRMAIGAKSVNILSQFLIEAILVCIIGGVLGIMLSFGIGYVFNEVVKGDFVMDFSTSSIVLALISSSLIGIIFGYIPAKNASKLNPINALTRT